MKIFVAGGTGAIGRPLIAKLLAKGHALVALTRSQEKAQALVERGIEPAIADVFDADAVKAVISRAQPEIMPGARRRNRCSGPGRTIHTQKARREFSEARGEILPS